MYYKNTQGARHLGIGGSSELEMPLIFTYRYGISAHPPNPHQPHALHLPHSETTQTPPSPHLVQPNLNTTPDRKVFSHSTGGCADMSKYGFRRASYRDDFILVKIPLESPCTRRARPKQEHPLRCQVQALSSSTLEYK
jgi:hypothetical protein